jgi:hypothetical protein
MGRKSTRKERLDLMYIDVWYPQTMYDWCRGLSNPSRQLFLLNSSFVLYVVFDLY